MEKNKLNQLTKKIQEAVPEIIELKRGCYVKDFLKGKLMILAEYKLGDETPVYDFVFFGEDEVSVMRTPRGNWDIIGRDITLFDIKQCLRYNGYTIKEFVEIAKLWKYPNSFDEQSNKLKDKMYEFIITNKNE